MVSMGVNARRLPEVFELYLELAQYPILADRIRERMRKELFSRGVLGPEDLEREVEEKAILSQKREGLTDPFAQEPSELWKKRLARIRDNLTDFYFAHNLPHELCEEIVQAVVTEGAPYQEVPHQRLFARNEFVTEHIPWTHVDPALLDEPPQLVDTPSVSLAIVLQNHHLSVQREAPGKPSRCQRRTQSVDQTHEPESHGLEGEIPFTVPVGVRHYVHKPFLLGHPRPPNPLAGPP